MPRYSNIPRGGCLSFCRRSIARGPLCLHARRLLRSTASLTELLAFILSNPHLLTDPYFAKIAKAIRARHEALDGKLRMRFGR